MSSTTLIIVLENFAGKKHLVWRATSRRSDLVSHTEPRSSGAILALRQIEVKVISHFELGNQNSGGYKFHFFDLVCFPVYDK